MIRAAKNAFNGLKLSFLAGKSIKILNIYRMLGKEITRNEKIK